jgi:hypothetical protein
MGHRGHGRHVSVYLHHNDGSPTVEFRAEDLKRGDRPHTSHRGIRGWFERKVAHYQTSWRAAHGPLVRRLRTVWDWLHRRTYADEPFLSHLRSVGSLEVGHDAALGREDAVALWRCYLRARGRRHAAWLALNAAIAPVTVVLAPIPGPNLIGYWFAYRAIHHGLILTGLARAKKGEIATSFRPADPEAVSGEPSVAAAGNAAPAPAPQTDARPGSDS